METLPKTVKIVYADDDADDHDFFKEALNEIPVNTELTTVQDGVELMHLLNDKDKELPNVLYLDIQMPRKNGKECLKEIKAVDELKNVPVVILSTALESNLTEDLYKEGAHYYIRKPGTINELKKVVHHSLNILSVADSRPERNKFVIKPDDF